MTVVTAEQQSHLSRLTRLSIASRLLVSAIAYIASRLAQFDSSARLLTDSSWAQTLLRWDAFHFLHIAQQGYVYEHEWAFFSGVPLSMRLGSLVPHTDGRYLLLAGALFAMSCESSRTLYHLSLYHLQSPSLAFVASILSLLPSSPATLRLVAYAEPFFTFFSYKGMLYCTRSQWFYAALCFCFASAFRSNGILLGGFLIWGMLVTPIYNKRLPPLRHILACSCLVLIIFAPFLYHQYAAYNAFCSTSERAVWCSNSLPLIYSYVQGKYWDVGFLRYWTPQQLPNFLIAAPPLLTIISFSIHHLKNTKIPFLNTSTRKSTLFHSTTITPHAIHALILSATLLFASHTQIVLRFAASMPITYWAAAWLVAEHPRLGRWWIIWSVMWGALSIILWGAFLPPA